MNPPASATIVSGESPEKPPSPVVQQRPGRGGALFVAAGILFSRLFGLVRERALAHFFGNSIESAAFKAATRIPNFLQNLFGEGVLSASFIPVYAQLIEKKDRAEADRVAGAVFGLLALAMSVLVAVGIVATPLFVETVAPGFHGESRALTIELVRILFPGTAMLVLSAWCLGILNSHRRFFLPYAAPVLWNVAIIGTLIVAGRHESQERLVRYVAWGFVGGCFLQFAVQLPTVLRLLKSFRPSLNTGNQSVRQVLRSFVPVVIGRGVVQVSAYVDVAYASLISERALSALNYAQTLYLIPVSLFGMSISAAELPEMSRTLGSADEVAAKLRTRIAAKTRQIAFYVVPAAAAFLLLGDVIGSALLRTGRFTAADARYLWYLLMGATVGLAATTTARLYSSAFYALRLPKIPLYFATIRVALTAGLAWWSAVRMPGAFGLPRELGGVGITATTGIAAWIEFLLLRHRLQKEIGHMPSGLGVVLRLWMAALIANLAGLGVKVALTAHFGVVPGALREWKGGFLPMPHMWPVLTALIVLPVVGLIYGGVTWAMGIEESRALVQRVAGRIRRAR